MAQRSKLWRAAGLAFIAINFAGGIYAAVIGEWMHASVHAVLLALGLAAYSAYRMRTSTDVLPQETVDRLKDLEQSVDALAVSIERVGEAQRYQTKMLDEKVKNASKQENR